MTQENRQELSDDDTAVLERPPEEETVVAEESVQDNQPEDTPEEDAVAEEQQDAEASEESKEETSEEDSAPEESSEEESTEGAEEVRDATDDLRVLEALLFASAQPLTTNAIRERMGEDVDVGGLLMQLKENYEGRGVQLVELDGNWAFRTSGDLGDALQMTKEVQRKLSRAAMETLAIVAYHQPVTRAEIENIRGVATNKGTLDVLMEVGWVKPGRRRETPGRPLTWITTTAFLDHFGLESMSDLPGLDDLKASGLLDRRPAIDTIPTGELFADDDLEESEDDDIDDDDAFDEEAAASENQEQDENDDGIEFASEEDDDEYDDDDDFDDDEEDEI